MPYKNRERKREAARRHYRKVGHTDEYKRRVALNSKKYIENNRDKVNAKRRIYEKKNPERVRNWRLKNGHGISLDTYNALLNAQGNVCAICSRTEISKQGNLHVDHNHLTGKVRGLLCTKCNTSLGLMDENISLIYKLIEYLNKHHG